MLNVTEKIQVKWECREYPWLGLLGQELTGDLRDSNFNSVLWMLKLNIAVIILNSLFGKGSEGYLVLEGKDIKLQL